MHETPTSAEKKRANYCFFIQQRKKRVHFAQQWNDLESILRPISLRRGRDALNIESSVITGLGRDEDKQINRKINVIKLHLYFQKDYKLSRLRSFYNLFLGWSDCYANKVRTQIQNNYKRASLFKFSFTKFLNCQFSLSLVIWISYFSHLTLTRCATEFQVGRKTLNVTFVHLYERHRLRNDFSMDLG